MKTLSVIAAIAATVIGITIVVLLAGLLFAQAETNSELRQQNFDQCMTDLGASRTDTDLDNTIRARDICAPSEG